MSRSIAPLSDSFLDSQLSVSKAINWRCNLQVIALMVPIVEKTCLDFGYCGLVFVKITGLETLHHYKIVQIRLIVYCPPCSDKRRRGKGETGLAKVICENSSIDLHCQFLQSKRRWRTVYWNRWTVSEIVHHTKTKGTLWILKRTTLWSLHSHYIGINKYLERFFRKRGADGKEDMFYEKHVSE